MARFSAILAMLMWPFGKKSGNILGVDLGSHGVKLVELGMRKGRPYLHTYGYSEASLARGDGERYLPVEHATSLLKETAIKSRVSVKRARAGIPASAVVATVITLPSADKKEIKAAVEREAEKIVTIPRSEVSLDWKLISPTPEEKERRIQLVLLTAAPKSVLAAYSEIFRGAGLELSTIEPEVFGVIRSLIGQDPSPAVVVDIGAGETDVYLVERGAPFAYRTLKVGGERFTAMLAEKLGVEKTAAEQMKKDLAGAPAMPQTKAGLPEVFAGEVRPIVDAVQALLGTFRAQNTNGRVDRIILTGGGSQIPGLAGELESVFNVKAYLGDPWARVNYDDGLKPILHSAGPRFAVAVGLALSA